MVRIGGHLHLFGTESKKGSHKHQRGADADPKGKEKEDRQEGDGRGGSSNAQKDVEDAKDTNHCSRKASSRVHGVELPSLGVAELVETGRNVSSHTTTENVENENGREGLSLLHGVEKFENGANHGEEKGRSDLSTGSNQNTEEHRGELRGAEDISVDQLPAGFFLGFFERLHLVVSRDILAERADHNGGNGTRQEQDNHEGVDNCKVMDIVVGATNEVDIPTVSPGQFAFLPFNRVGVNDLEILSGGSGTEGQVGGGVVNDFGSAIGVTRFDFRVGAYSSTLVEFVLKGNGVDIKTGNVHTVARLSVGDCELQVVVEIKFVRLESRVPGLESDGVPSNGVIEVAAPHEHGELVKGEMDSVLPLDQLSHPSQFPSSNVYLTERTTSMVLLDLEDERGGFKLQSLEAAAQILSHFALADGREGGWFADWHIVVFKGYLCFLGVDHVGEHDDFFVKGVLDGAHTGKEDLGEGGVAFAQQTLAFLFAELVMAHSGRFGRVTDFVHTLTTHLQVARRCLLV